MDNGEMKAEDISLKEDTDRLIRNHVIGSMGVGLIPFPVLDIMALAGVQLNMLRRLAERYNVPFSKDMGKHIIASLLGGGLPVSVGGTLASFIKSIPLIGQAGGILTMPVVAGASTYAVGKVFIQHFASGGTFLNFDPETVRSYYAEMFKEGENVVAGLKISEVFDEADTIVTEFAKRAEKKSVSAEPETVSDDLEPSDSDMVKESQASEPENLSVGSDSDECLTDESEIRYDEQGNLSAGSDSDGCLTDESEIRGDEQDENPSGEWGASRAEGTDICPDEPKKKKKSKRKKAKTLSL